MKNAGKLVISLDLELNWGVFDVFPDKRYQNHLLGARQIVPLLLKKFQHYNIHATWAVVGFLYFSTKRDLVKEIPANQPNYKNPALSAYHHIKNVGENEMKDPLHFGSLLIEQIKDTPNQEIATHTFSHYYCLAEGQNKEAFEEDLKKAVKVAKKQLLSVQTIVFPRNQIEPSYLPICENNGLAAYRGCENNWLYYLHPNGDGRLKRALRLLDSYLPITGHHVYALDRLQEQGNLVNIPSSSFLRPYSKRLSMLEFLKLNRIKTGMTKAAKEGKLYHLWWHPHNFGVNRNENMHMLGIILEHFQQLRKHYGMESLTMGEVSNQVRNKPIGRNVSNGNSTKMWSG